MSNQQRFNAQPSYMMHAQPYPYQFAQQPYLPPPQQPVRTIPLKFHLGHTIVRRSVGVLSSDEIEKVIKAETQGAPYELFYRDEDKDFVVLSTPDEWKEAIAVYSKITSMFPTSPPFTFKIVVSKPQEVDHFDSNFQEMNKRFNSLNFPPEPNQVPQMAPKQQLVPQPKVHSVKLCIEQDDKQNLQIVQK